MQVYIENLYIQKKTEIILNSKTEKERSGNFYDINSLM